jgi:hypothetical protein
MSTVRVRFVAVPDAEPIGLGADQQYQPGDLADFSINMAAWLCAYDVAVIADQQPVPDGWDDMVAAARAERQRLDLAVTLAESARASRNLMIDNFLGGRRIR